MNLSIILNEKKYALSCIQERSIGESSWLTAQILAKYYYWELGYRKKKIEKELTEFISECDSQYRKNKQRWEENIEKLAANAGNYPLFKDDYIPITEGELKIIRDSDLPKQHQQVLFTYLCLAKLGNMRNEKNNGWVNYKTRDVFKLAHVSLSELNQDIMLNDFYVRKLVAFPKKNDNLSVRVTFCEDQGDIAMTVSDFRDLGYYYLMQIGENIVQCVECGTYMRGNKTKTKKYCKNCAGYKPQEVKTVTCVDCGEEFQVSAYNTKSCRCEACKVQHRREYDRNRKKIPLSL